MELEQTNNTKIAVVAWLTFLSWLGAYIHTTLELQLPVWSPENSGPALVGFLLFLAWWQQPNRRRLWGGLLLGWTFLGHFLLGGILSAIPTPFWPFYPEQSLSHYFSHVIYSVTQLPLMWVLWREIRR